VLNRLSISVKVFLAPVVITMLMLTVLLVSNVALKTQQDAFLGVVGGSLTTSTATTRLLLAVADLQSAMLRYAQVQQRSTPDDPVLNNLRRSILDRYISADQLFTAVKATSGPGEADAVSNISDFFTIHRAVAQRILDSESSNATTVSTLMAHYQQLQDYIVELATRSLETAQAAEARTRRNIETFLNFLLIASAAAVLLSIALTYWIGRAISKPITQMVAVMSTIAGGNSSVQVPGTDRRDEIGDMAMAVEVFSNVTKELRDREQSLIESRAQAQMASQHKSQFLANMSHELRTPLNAIIGITEMLHDDAVDLKRDDELESLERVLRAGRHLLALINDILDLSKIEAGKMDLTLESVQLQPLVEEVASTMRPIACKNGNVIEVTCAPDLGMALADPMRLRQALLNLASNAAKFTENGSIRIGGSRVHSAGVEWIKLDVTDTGIGMTPAQVERLFQEFVQADASTTRKYGGTGLGLAISQRFCRMMGGDITVESSVGRGSVFSIRIPAAGAEGARPIARPPRAEHAQRLDAAVAEAPVLVIDDDPTVRQLMVRYLEREGFVVVTADNGITGLALARELHPSAITLDVMMPELNGWTVLSALKGDPALSDIPVVLVSIVDDKQRGYMLGATEYLVKPVDRDKLVTTLRALCGIEAGRLLLVEDDEVARPVITQTMEREGWTVSQAANGRIALERLSGTRPDAIVLDLMMPEMDGFEFLVELRERQECNDIPVIVVTALDLSAADHARLNGQVERIIQKSGQGQDQLLQEVVASVARVVRHKTPPARAGAEA